MTFNHPSVLDWFLDFLWPCRCAFCGEIIAPPARCCKKCAGEFSLCPSFPVAGLDAVFAFTDYSHRVAHAVHLLKFQNQPQLAVLFAQLIDSRFHQQLLDCTPDCICFVSMYPKKEKQRGYNHQNQPQLAVLFAQLIDSRFHQQLLDCTPDCICFVSMYPKKEKQRGYNQAKLIAEELGRCLSLPCCPLLKKTASTAAQHTLSAEQRKRNLRGVYTAVAPEQIAGKRILLVDDVITTGSTMTECAGVLIEHGAVWVGGVCFAHPVV